MKLLKKFECHPEATAEGSANLSKCVDSSPDRDGIRMTVMVLI